MRHILWGGVRDLNPIEAGRCREYEVRQVSGHGLAVANGPNSKSLAAAIGVMFENSKTVALGMISTSSFNRDPDGISRQAALNLIEGTINGALVR